MKYNTGLLFLILLSLPLRGDPVSVIYSAPDPSRFGRDFSREKTVIYRASDFKSSIIRKAAGPVLTPVIIGRDVYSGIVLFAESNERYITPFVSLWINEFGRIEFHDEQNNIHTEFECIPAPPQLLTHIKETYTNSYWQDIVLKEYSGSYIFRFYSGNDLNRDGIFSIRDAMALSSLFGAKEQPLWGIHNGSGYLDNIYYSLLNREYERKDMYVSYRDDDESADRLIALIKQIEAEYEDFPRGMYDTVTGMLQYEGDETAVIQAPEEFIRADEGDKLDFALLFFDLLTRKGFETRTLAAQTTRETEDTDYIVCFREPETFVWNAVEMYGFHEELTEEIETIPALIFKQTLFYAVIDPALVISQRRPPQISDWMVSVY